MQKTDTIDKLAIALSKAQAEMPVVGKTETNPFLKNKYASLDSIIQVVYPVLTKHELSILQLPFNFRNGDFVEIGVNTILLHASGQWIAEELSLPLDEEKGKSQAQVAGSIITYLRRYTLSAMLGIATEEDTDGQAPAPKQQAVAMPAGRMPTVDGTVKLPRTLPEPSIPHVPDPDWEFDDAVPMPPRKMTMTPEMAAGELSQDGTPYGELSKEQLGHRLRGIMAGLKKAGITPEKREELERKRDAALTLINDPNHH